MATRLIVTMYKKHPLLSNMVIYAGLYGAGDLARQTIARGERYDFFSAGRMAIVGSCCLGPFNFKWYKFLDKILPGTSIKTLPRKIVLDQLVAGQMGVLIFYLGTAVLERQPDVTKELREKYVTTYKTSCIFWPCAQTINFTLVPSQLRTMYVGCAAFIWTIILSYYKSGGTDSDKPSV